MSQENFQKFIRKVNNQVNAYYEESSTNFGCIVLHEHLGLVENVVRISQFLVGPKMTLMIPDLFATVTQKSLLNNQFDGIKKLSYGHVEDVVKVCLQYIGKKCKFVILIGFSIGAAFGLKIVERMKSFQQAYLFYGLPNLDYLDINQITTECTLFYGTEDKIKYLSDPRMYDHMKNKALSKKNITFEQINGAGHGFMNPESPNFSEENTRRCKEILANKLPKDAVVVPASSNSEKNKDDCVIF